MRCPHCGEPVQAGQKTCFACGEKLRVRRLGQTTFDYRIVIAGGVLVLVGVLGVIFTLSGTRKAAGAKASRRVAAKVATSQPEPRPAEPRTESLTAAKDGDVLRAQEQLLKLKRRYEVVKGQVLGETPTQEQRTLMSQIDRELGLLGSAINRLTSPLAADERKKVEQEIASRVRGINTLISQFSRAPKNR